MSIFDMFQPREPQTGGVGDTPLYEQYTPDRIATLGPNDIFVFGSNSMSLLTMLRIVRT